MAKVTLTKGTGYWDLRYPWGGSFRRLDADIEVSIDKVFNTYNDDSPKEIQVTINGLPCGFKL